MRRAGAPGRIRFGWAELGELDRGAADAVNLRVFPAVFYTGPDAGRGEGVVGNPNYWGNFRCCLLYNVSYLAILT